MPSITAGARPTPRHGGWCRPNATQAIGPDPVLTPGAVLFGRGRNSIATPPCFPLYVCGVVVVASHNGAAVWNHECAI